MPAMELPGLISALASALVWGSGDFAGGLAARRSTQFQVVAVASLSGLLGLALVALLLQEPIPPPTSLAWAAGAGIAGAAGMAALYRGLAGGRAALVAPTSGVVGAALPVVIGSLTEGLPGAADLAGMAIGIAGIWLVSQGGPTSEARRTDRGLLMGIAAGMGFGGYFVLIAQVEPGPVFSPLVAAKLAAFVVALLAVVVQRRSLPALRDNPIAPIAGLLDAGGNVLYLVAAQLTRLDFAVVLASMYPASTVVLSRLILHERISRRQWAGGAMCLAAVALIALP